MTSPTGTVPLPTECQTYTHTHTHTHTHMGRFVQKKKQRASDQLTLNRIIRTHLSKRKRKEVF